MPRLAALLYDDGPAADALLLRFIAARQATGAVVRGVVQLPPAEPGCGPEAPMLLRDIASGEVIRLCQDLGPGADACRLDPDALARAAARLRAAITQPSDLLVVSKFGKQEASGQGFRDEIAEAVAEGRSVLTTVKRPLLAEFQAFTGGLARLLPPEEAALRAWWDARDQ